MVQQTRVSPRVRWLIMLVDRLAIAISAHWLALINAVLFAFSGLPVLAPVLMHYGLNGPAELIYAAYRFTCHELPYRSFFMFGAQPVYELDYLSALTGRPGEDLVFWSGFIGNSQLGYKMAWCERDAAIYASLIIAGLLFAAFRTRIPPLDWRVYVVILVPMAIDGFWQLLTSPLHVLPFLPVHESTWWLRVITGVLFGAGSVWLIYPYLATAMSEVQVDTRAQLQRAIEHQNES